MFKRINYNSKAGSYILEDTDFSFILPAQMSGIRGIIMAYELYNLPIAPNLALYYRQRYDKSRHRHLFIDEDAAYYNSYYSQLNFNKYKKCLINQIKKLDYING